MNNTIKTTSVVMAQIQANAIQIMIAKGQVDPEHKDYYTDLKRITLNLHAQLKDVI